MSRESDRSELEAALAACLPDGYEAHPRSPELYRATVAGVSGEDVIVEIGPRVQGVVALAEFDEPPSAGATIDVALRGREDGLWAFSTRAARALSDWESMEVGSHVKGNVIGINRGGLELKVSGHNAFLPASQLGLGHVEDLAAYAGQTLVCEVLEIDRAKKRIVVSRRAVLEEERARRREDTMEAIAVGSVVRGRVTRIEPFGAFIELAPGVEGLVHVSNLSHKRVEHPSELLKAGEEIEVQVLDISEGGKRIGLGRKQLLSDPWDTIADRLHEDDVVNGKVQRVVEFGAFVEVEPGVDGLLHVSELGSGRVRSVRDVLKPGEELAVRVLSLDVHARRLSLSRLDPHGAPLGSEEAADSADVDVLLRRDDRPLGTNLGSLFKKALKKD